MTVVTGDNGAGKTSLLEAVAYSSTLRSFRGSSREALIRTGSAQAVVRLETQDNARSALVELEITAGRRDTILKNKQRVQRSAELVEVLRTTVFTPDDLTIVKDGPQGRRDFIDNALTDARPKMTLVTQNVERILRQRNTLLKQSGGRPTAEVLSTLDVWDEQLAREGTRLIEAREGLLQEILAYARTAFQRLSRMAGDFGLRYERSFDRDLAAALEQSRTEDLRRGVTTLGPHRDEIVITVGDLDARGRISQGQQRCAVLALRLAAHATVAKYAGSEPVLLLDDAFSELDETTTRALLEEMPIGQAILTTASPIPEGLHPTMLLKLKNGTIQQ